MASPVGDASSRLALVIGNGAYAFSPLRNPVNDATDVATTLRELGFTVISRSNANLRSMKEALEEFGNRLKKGGVGLFYYAGHGVQIGGVNYLIPVAADIKNESDVEFEALDAGRVLAKMADANNGLNIVILDACRDNPFARKFRSVSRGLAGIDRAPLGTLISYSTGPGQVAQDGEGRNSPYTSALLECMKQPGLPIEQVFKGVRETISTRTDGAQVPWEMSSLRGQFFFRPVEATVNAPSPGALAPAPVASLDLKKPADSNFTLQDLEKKAQQVESNKAAWARTMEGMKADFQKVAAYEKRDITPDLKIAAWQRLLDTYKENNPYTDEDETLRAEAGKQITHWQEEKSRRKQKLAMAKPAPPSAPATPSTYTDPVTGMEFVLVRGGCYDMGDTFGDGYPDEKPVHEVCVSDFYMGRYEVTQGQWKGITGNNPSLFKNCGDACPVESVLWDDVQGFIRTLNGRTGKSFRLPTEAEWEYAARSGGKKEEWAGTGSESDLDAYAWYLANSGEKTHPVGQKRPNGLGLYDMSGNVYEWVRDFYSGTYYRMSPRDNPKGPDNGVFRVRRGGRCDNSSRNVRAAYRYGGDPAYWLAFLGFRLLLPLR